MNFWGGVSGRNTGSTHKGFPGTKMNLRQPISWAVHKENILRWVLGCNFIGSLSLCSVYREKHGNPGTGMNFSPPATPLRAQKAELAPASTPAIHLEQLDEVSDQDDVPVQVGCTSPVVVPPPVTTPAAALEPRPACMEASDLIEASPPLSEEPSFPPALAPGREEDLENALALSLPPEVILPILLDFILLFSLIAIFSFSLGCNEIQILNKSYYLYCKCVILEHDVHS